MKLYDLKEKLKKWAIECRTLKNSRKQDKRNGRTLWKIVCDIKSLKHKIRHHHIAYCELRGTERHRIERKFDEAPSERYIEEIKNKYAPRIIDVKEKPDEAVCVSA